MTIPVSLCVLYVVCQCLRNPEKTEWVDDRFVLASQYEFVARILTVVSIGTDGVTSKEEESD